MCADADTEIYILHLESSTNLLPPVTILFARLKSITIVIVIGFVMIQIISNLLSLS